MKAIICYLLFEGDCRQAMTFYAEALGAELQLSTFAEMPDCPPGAEQRVMHARLSAGAAVLMASDAMPGMQQPQGRNFSISVDCESVDEQTKQFAALAVGGAVTMELQDTFWGARFGMLRDKFGLQWMFNCDVPRQAVETAGRPGA